MGIKGGRKGKSGVYSTDVNELERLAADKDSPGARSSRKVLDWRQLSKLKSTYTDALQAQINPETGRVHTSYSLTGAQTGRLSSTDPNLQNIPIRTEIGRQIRDAFVAEPGNVLLAADYSQIELRLAAHMADVPALQARRSRMATTSTPDRAGAVRRGQPRHARARQDDQLRDPLRHLALGPGRPARRRPPDEAQAMIDRYFERFPGINRYIADDARRACASSGYHRRRCSAGRRTSRGSSRKRPARAPGRERAAINAPIQGTSADIIKRAMVRMGPALARRRAGRRADAAAGARRTGVRTARGRCRGARSR